MHLLDVTMLYAPTSGGVVRYLRAKRAWLKRHTSIRHSLLAAGAADARGTSGERYLRALAIELAWSWLRRQPQSALSQWYRARFANGGPRVRRIGIVALARKLLIALCAISRRACSRRGRCVKRSDTRRGVTLLVRRARRCCGLRSVDRDANGPFVQRGPRAVRASAVSETISDARR